MIQLASMQPDEFHHLLEMLKKKNARCTFREGWDRILLMTVSLLKQILQALLFVYVTTHSFRLFKNLYRNNHNFQCSYLKTVENGSTH